MRPDYVSFNSFKLKQRKKLNAKSLECVLLGFGDHKKAYRLLHRPTGRILESHDVVFDEGDPDTVPTRIVISTEPVFPSETGNAPRTTRVVSQVEILAE